MLQENFYPNCRFLKEQVCYIVLDSDGESVFILIPMPIQVITTIFNIYGFCFVLFPYIHFEQVNSSCLIMYKNPLFSPIWIVKLIIWKKMRIILSICSHCLFWCRCFKQLWMKSRCLCSSMRRLDCGYTLDPTSLVVEKNTWWSN